jgi:hypothetical protein
MVIPVVVFPKGKPPHMQNPDSPRLGSGCQHCRLNVFLGERHSYHCEFLACTMCGAPSVASGAEHYWDCTYGSGVRPTDDPRHRPT